MYLFFNKSDNIIQAFGIVDFESTGESGFNSLLHKQYKGNFKIPQIFGDLRVQEITTEQDQDTFTLDFDYKINKNNICIEKQVDGVFQIIDPIDYQEFDINTIVFETAFDSGVVLRFSSNEIIEYIFDENSETFSVSD